MFKKKDKKLSEEDLENWNRLKESLDFKFNKKLYQITDLEKTKLLHKDHNNVMNYKLKQNNNKTSVKHNKKNYSSLIDSSLL